MRFQVPQFIEIEDKIFGPLTFKQFIYVGGGVGACVILFLFLPNFIALILSAPIAAFAGALAFFKINDKPFIHLVEAFFKYHTGSKLYIWKKKEKKPEPKKEDSESKPVEKVYVPKLSQSKLKQLAWRLDIEGNQNPITESQDK
jgi:uncharacterized membrane protein